MCVTENTHEVWRGQGNRIWKRVNVLYHSEVRPFVRIEHQYVVDPHQANGVCVVEVQEALWRLEVTHCGAEVERGRYN